MNLIWNKISNIATDFNSSKLEKIMNKQIRGIIFLKKFWNKYIFNIIFLIKKKNKKMLTKM